MTRWVIAGVVAVIVVIVGVTLYLSPDSLSKCGESPSAAKGCQKADAIIAVSGGDTTARTQQAIDLYKSGWADQLIFSGAAMDTSGPSNAEVMRHQALDQGIPDDAIAIDTTSIDTQQNARNTAAILAEHDVRSAIVVTSGYHTKRTLIEFRSSSPSIEFRSHPVSGDRQWSIWWWTTPIGWWLAGGEIVKIIIGKLGGGF